MIRKPVRVLIVDDSALFRKVLQTQLEKYEDIEIIGTASDVYEARYQIIENKPDVITLDIEMPRMDGITFLHKLMKSKPLPVIILSSQTNAGGSMALKAFDEGAIDVLDKPANKSEVNEMVESLHEKILGASQIDINQYLLSLKQAPTQITSRYPGQSKSQAILAIGASTGGTDAIRRILTALPSDGPPTVVVQHMPKHFTKSFAERLNRESAMSVKEAENGDSLRQGLVLIAPGDFHMLLKKSPGGYRVILKTGPMVYHQRPSVEVLFNSVASEARENAIGVILTGMGKDGAKGLLKMKEAGALTLAQSEESCVVFGMPKEAIDLGAPKLVLSLDKIPIRILAGI